MVTIGSTHGIRFDFDKGLLASIKIERHRKPIYQIKEEILSADPLNITDVNPPYPVVGAPPEATANFEQTESGDFLPDNTSLLQTSQDFGIGRRQIELFRYKKAEGSQKSSVKDYDQVIASIIFTFKLAKEAVSQITLPNIEGITQSEKPDSFLCSIRLQNKTVIEFKSTEKISVNLEAFGSRQNARLQIRLPQGPSKIEIKVSSLPDLSFGDTLVVCRPDQLKEAAIVLSCIGSQKFTPLLVIDPPPISIEEHKERYRQYLTAMRKSTSITGGDLGIADVPGKKDMEEVFKAVVGHWALLPKLTPFRSWMTHNTQLARIFADASFKRAIFLFHPQKEDLEIPNPEIEVRSADEENVEENNGQRKFEPLQLIPDNITERIFLLPKAAEKEDTQDQSRKSYYYDDLPGLTHLAWETLKNTVAKPEKYFYVPEAEESLFLVGLFRALREQIPILPSGKSAPSLEEANKLANEDINPKEIVLIEHTGDASELLGIIYATYQNAGLVVVTKPDLKEINAAVNDFQQKQEQGAKDYLYLQSHRSKIETVAEFTEQEKSAVVSLPDEDFAGTEIEEFKRGRFIDAVKRYLLGDWRPKAVENIEAAVSSQVPDYAIQLIGDRILTALTTGVPYSFLKKNGHDWSAKSIGHVAGDVSLILLSEIYKKGTERPPITYSLVFDPGYFTTSETEDVLKNLEQHFTHSLLLSKESASIDALIRLTGQLPVESIYFNTHGSDNAIILGDFPLDRDRIAQWIKLNTLPIVFNNSCLSWVGVGREFIRAGARGYIGTLWSVNAKEAAEFGRVAMRRMIEQGACVSEAICKTDVNPYTERAYLYIGTASARLDQWQDSGLKEEKDFLLGAARSLIEVLDGLSSDRTIQSYDESLFKFLYEEQGKFVARLEAMPDSDTVELVDLYLTELGVLANREILKLSYGPDYEKGIFNKCLNLLDKLKLSKEMDLPRRASAYHQMGEINYYRREINSAITNLNESISYEKASGHFRGWQYQILIDIYKNIGMWEQARETALLAKDVHEQNKDDRGDLVTIGRLGQICKRLGEDDDALKYAKEGYAMSVKLDDRREQAAFKSDEAQMYLKLQRPDRAIAAAEEAASTFRTVFDRDGEMKAFGILGHCYLMKGELQTAEKYASLGLEQAAKLQDKIELATFLSDLGMIKSRSGDIDEAIKYFEEACVFMAELNNFEILCGVISLLKDLYIKSKKWEQFFFILNFELTIFIKVDLYLQSALFAEIIKNIISLLGLVEQNLLRQSLYGIWETSARLLETQKDETANYLRFISSFIYMLDLWIEGRDGEAKGMAANLDEGSGKTFNLLSLVSQPYSRTGDNKISYE